MGEMNNARFKFRVYVSGRKKTYDVISIEYRWFNHELETIAAFLGDNEETVEYVTVDCVHNTLEQCTGLEDENGKLIFEGDKVRMTEFYFDGCGESERNFVGYVMWNKCEFVLSKNLEKPEYENETEIIPHISWGHSFEIVGNIHEVE